MNRATLRTQIEPFYVALGRRIFEHRINAKLTQAQLGAKLAKPLKRAAIANIETGKQRVLAHTLVEIARALEVSLLDVVPGEVTMSAEQDVERKLLAHEVPERVAKLLATGVIQSPAPRRKP